MFVRIVDHWCKPGQREAGLRRMEAVGEVVSAAPGFMFRYRLEAIDDPALLTTLTAWEDEAAFRAFHATRPKTNPQDPSSPFERIEHRAFRTCDGPPDK